MEPLIQDDDVILLGGYKGLLHSMEMKGFLPLDEQKEYGAVYLDPDTNLLHDMARIKVLE